MIVKGKDRLMMSSDRKAATKVLAEDSDFDAPMDDDEPTSEELVEMLRQALHEAKTGQTRPVEELLRELDEIRAENEAAG